jgi:hypothetical protein
MTEEVRRFRMLVSYRGGLAADHNPETRVDHESAAGFPPEGPLDSQQIKDAGLKVTGPRVKILAVLEHSGRRHLSAEDVYKALLENEDDVGLATVYRVLTQFEGAGLYPPPLRGQSIGLRVESGWTPRPPVCALGKVVEP